VSSDFETLKKDINSELKKLNITIHKAPDSSDELPKLVEQLMMLEHGAGGDDNHNYGVAELAGLVQQYITDNNIRKEN
jgi:hypothetical protein